MKLLTARVLRLEQAMSRQKKVSVIKFEKDTEKPKKGGKLQYVPGVDKQGGEQQKKDGELISGPLPLGFENLNSGTIAS